MRVGPMPAPTHAPPAVGLEEVTNGYVPWSTSSIVAWPPSMSTCSPRSRASLSTRSASITMGWRRSA